MTETCDLLIHGGMVVDGSGAPGFAADVAVVGDRLRILPRSTTAAVDSTGAIDLEAVPAARRIDASGLVVAPGFIVLHSHAGLTMLAEPRHEPKVRQGVTTEVVGVDGNSYAPFTSQHDLDDFRTLNAGLDGRPDIAYDWRTVGDYLDRFDQRVSVNVAYLMGNSALRIAAIGWDEVEADARAQDRQRGLLREGMEDGAFGLSSGLDYPPGSYASTDELAALLAEAARLGGIYHTHVRYDLGDRFLDPFREAIEIGRRSGGGPVHLTHFYHRAHYPGTPDQLLALVDDARAEGQDVTFDLYPDEWSSTRLLIMLPPWIQAGGVARLKERLTDRATRARMRDEMAVRGRFFAGDRTWADLRLGAFTKPEHARWESQTLADVMADTGKDPVDAICDLLLAEDLGVNQVAPGPHKAGTVPFWQHPVSMVGSDGVMIADKPAPRTYGTYPRILGEFVREDGLTGLEEAVRKMTSAPAARLGITDRGLLRDGMLADIVVFDPATVRSMATYDEPRRFPVGIPTVIVNGEVVVDGGEHTGALPGRALRRGHPTA